MHIRRFLHALAATAALVGGAGALAAPYAITYHGTIANSLMPAQAPDGTAFTLTLVMDNGGTTAASQNWSVANLTCGFWRWNSVAVALDLSGGVALGMGSAATNAAGVLTGVFADVHTGPLLWTDYSVSGLPLLAGADLIGWYADGGGQPFNIQAPWGATFDDGVAGGGVNMVSGRWSAPRPFTGTCDASAMPPVASASAAAPVPTLSQWGVLLLSALLGLLALRRRGTR